ASEPRGVSVKRRMFVGTSKTLVIGSLAIACAFSSSVTANAAAPTPNVQPPYTADFFGISAGAEITNLSDADFDREMNMMQKIGVHWVRAVFPWAKVQSLSADPLDEEWVYIDRLYNYARALGMQLVAI